jgi:hypothetical protein
MRRDRSFSDWVLWVRIMRDHRVANLPERLSPPPPLGVDHRAIDDRSADAASRARFEAGVRRPGVAPILDAFSADGIASETRR